MVVFGEHYISRSISKRASRFTESKALRMSTNARQMPFPPVFCSRAFSTNCRVAKTMSTVDLSALKPHWESTRNELTKGVNLLHITFARTLPGTDRSDIPL